MDFGHFFLLGHSMTLIGFLFTLGPFVFIFWYYGTQMGQYGSEISGIFTGLYGLCYFIYRMLDEMDGKQARKTGNSSPLGLLFDHGCDAFSIGFVILTTSKIL